MSVPTRRIDAEPEYKSYVKLPYYKRQYRPKSATNNRSGRRSNEDNLENRKAWNMTTADAGTNLDFLTMDLDVMISKERLNFVQKGLTLGKATGIERRTSSPRTRIFPNTNGPVLYHHPNLDSTQADYLLRESRWNIQSNIRDDPERMKPSSVPQIATYHKQKKSFESFDHILKEASILSISYNDIDPRTIRNKKL